MQDIEIEIAILRGPADGLADKIDRLAQLP